MLFRRQSDVIGIDGVSRRPSIHCDALMRNNNHNRDGGCAVFAAAIIIVIRKSIEIAISKMAKETAVDGGKKEAQRARAQPVKTARDARWMKKGKNHFR